MKPEPSFPFPPPPPGYAQRLARHTETDLLVPTTAGAMGREVLLAPQAAQAWGQMHERAVGDGVALLLLSGFRSVARQTEIIAKKLAAGEPLDEILRVNAYPGFSEHHTGCAIDIGSPCCEHLTEAFEHTPEFAWLHENAAVWGFRLSYPRGNPTGIAYEPWHWRFL